MFHVPRVLQVPVLAAAGAAAPAVVAGTTRPPTLSSAATEIALLVRVRWRVLKGVSFGRNRPRGTPSARTSPWSLQCEDEPDPTRLEPPFGPAPEEQTT